MVGVVPNAAYRHFADRDALLAAVSDEAVGELARANGGTHGPGTRGAAHADGRPAPAPGGRPGLSRVRTHRARPLRHRVRRHRPPSAQSGARANLGRSQHLQSALDNLVAAGILAPARRPDIEYPTWATVHGLAVLLRGPLSSLPDREKTRLEAQTLTFIGASVS